jgi:hypothetical protein
VKSKLKAAANRLRAVELGWEAYVKKLVAQQLNDKIKESRLKRSQPKGTPKNQVDYNIITDDIRD